MTGKALQRPLQALADGRVRVALTWALHALLGPLEGVGCALVGMRGDCRQVQVGILDRLYGFLNLMQRPAIEGNGPDTPLDLVPRICAKFLLLQGIPESERRLYP